jgi:hypothetical protein
LCSGIAFASFAVSELETGLGPETHRHTANEWSVGPAGQPDIGMVLMAIPGQPLMDPDMAEQVRSLMAKGFAGTIVLTTDDCRALQRLQGPRRRVRRGAEERPCGIDSPFRDLSGNNIRLTQVREMAAV